MSDATPDSSENCPPQGNSRDVIPLSDLQVAVVRPIIYDENASAAETNVSSTSESNPRPSGSFNTVSTVSISLGIASTSNQKGAAFRASTDSSYSSSSLSSPDSDSDVTFLVMGSGEDTDCDPPKHNDPVASTSGYKSSRLPVKGKTGDTSPPSSNMRKRVLAWSKARRAAKRARHSSPKGIGRRNYLRELSSRGKKSPQSKTSEPAKKTE